MNVRRNHTPWMISATLRHRHGITGQTETVYLARNQYKNDSPAWVDDPSPQCLFYGREEQMEKKVEYLTVLYKRPISGEFIAEEQWFHNAAKALMEMDQRVFSIELEQMTLVPIKTWAFKDGRTTTSTPAKSLHGLWKDAYSYFKAVLDTPIARRKVSSEEADELRKVMGEINDSIKPTIIG